VVVQRMTVAAAPRPTPAGTSLRRRAAFFPDLARSRLEACPGRSAAGKLTPLPWFVFCSP